MALRSVENDGLSIGLAHTPKELHFVAATEWIESQDYRVDATLHNRDDVGYIRTNGWG